MKKIISYSLYGDNPRYTIGAIKNATLAKKYMSDWTCRFYIDDTVPEWVVQTLQLIDNCELVKIGKEKESLFKMTHRLLALSDETVDVVVVRDADARISARDILAIDEWLASGLSFHIMKDHAIGHNYPIPGGCFGAKTNKIKNIEELLINFFKENPYHIYGIDQTFLAENIHPLIEDDCFYHSDYFDCNPTGKSVQKGFPSENRYPQNHVGAALDEIDGYIYSVDVDAAVNNHSRNKYLYDFDLLEEQ